jgi:hypothetical protein
MKYLLVMDQEMMMYHIHSYSNVVLIFHHLFTMGLNRVVHLLDNIL